MEKGNVGKEKKREWERERKAKCFPLAVNSVDPGGGDRPWETCLKPCSSAGLPELLGAAPRAWAEWTVVPLWFSTWNIRITEWVWPRSAAVSALARSHLGPPRGKPYLHPTSCTRGWGDCNSCIKLHTPVEWQRDSIHIKPFYSPTVCIFQGVFFLLLFYIISYQIISPFSSAVSLGLHIYFTGQKNKKDRAGTEHQRHSKTFWHLNLILQKRKCSSSEKTASLISLKGHSDELNHCSQMQYFSDIAPLLWTKHVLSFLSLGCH